MKTDVAIVGGGPGGSACAMYLARLGIKSVIIERETFPRFHIGESTTGEAGQMLRDLGFEQQMLKDRHPIKHGVTGWGGSGKNGWFVPIRQRLADGTLRELNTWNVQRSRLDKMMLDGAIAAGATLVPGRATQPILDDKGVVRGTRVLMNDGGTQTIESEMLLDCTGQATWLAGHGVTGPKYLGAYDKQIAIFAHVTGLQRDPAGSSSRDKQPGNTLIFYKEKFHWAWVIPVDDDVTSVGVVAPSRYYQDKRESKPDYLARELKELNPALAARCGDVKFVTDVHAIANYSLQVADFAGHGFICIGDAHRFLDPIFAIGLYMTMKEAMLIAPLVRDYLDGKRRDAKSPFEDHMLRVERGLDMLEDLIDTFWENPLVFSMFIHMSHREDIIDVLSGRVLDVDANPGVVACRDLLDRKRSYVPGSNYSMPIGSRYRPERAAIWNTGPGDVETTLAWMRDHYRA